MKKIGYFLIYVVFCYWLTGGVFFSQKPEIPQEKPIPTVAKGSDYRDRDFMRDRFQRDRW